MNKFALAVIAGTLATGAWAAPGPQGEPVRVSPENSAAWHSTAQVARTPDGGFVAAWYSWVDAMHDVDVMARVFGPDGTPASPVIAVNDLREGVQILASVDTDADGNFAVAWRSSDGEPHYGNRAIHARRFDRTGSPLGDEFRVDSLDLDYLTDPSLSMAPDGRFVVTWYGFDSVYARLYDAGGHPRGPERVVQAVYGDPHPDVAMRDDGSFVVAYSDSSVGSQSVALRGFDADGQLLFGRVQANPDEPNAHAIVPSITARPDGGVYVAWSRVEYPDANTSLFDTYVRRFDAAGVPQTPPTHVNEAAAYIFVSVGVDALGGATVVWPGHWDTSELYGRSLSQAGVPDGAPFIVNGTGTGITGYSQRAVAYDAQGNLVIVFHRDGAVYAQFYGPGTPPDDDPPGEDSPPDDDDPGCDHDQESDEDHDNGCGNDGDDDGGGNRAAARAAGDASPRGGALDLAMLLLLGGAMTLRRRRPKGAGRTSGSPARC